MSKYLDLDGLTYYHGKVQGEINQLDGKSSELKDVVDNSFLVENYTKEIVDFSTATVRNYNLIVSTTAYGTNGLYLHAIFKGEEGDVVDVTANPTYETKIAFVTNLDAPTSGGDIPVVSGTSVVTIPSGESNRFVAPSGTVAFLIYIGTGGAAPSYMAIYRPKEESFSGNRTVGVVSANRYRVGENNVEYLAANYGWSFPVKAGKRYLVDISNSGTAQKRYDVLSEIVAVDVPCSITSFTDAYAHFVVSAQSDGYFLLTKSSSAMTISVTELGIPVIEGEEKDLSMVMQYEEKKVSDYSLRDFAILTDTGNYGANNAFKNILIPVEIGSFVKITANATNPARVAFLTSDDAAASGEMPSYAQGTGPVVIPTGGTSILKAQSDYLYVYMGAESSSYPFAPDFIGIASPNSSYTPSQEMGDIEERLEPKISNFEVKDGSIKDDGTFGTSTAYGHGVIPVVAGQRFVVENRQADADTVRYAFVTSDVSTGTIPVVPGTEIGTVPHLSKKTVTIPTGCSYLIFNSKGYASSIYAVGEEFLSLQSIGLDDTRKSTYRSNIDAEEGPKLIKLVGIGADGASAGVSAVGDVYFNSSSLLLKKAVSEDSNVFTYETVPFKSGAIYQVMKRLFVWTGSLLREVTDATTVTLIGQGTTFISGSSFPALETGVKYRFLIEYPHSNIATTNYGLAFYKRLPSDTSSTRIIGWTSENVPDHYDIVAEDGYTYSVGGRAPHGQVAIVRVVRYSWLASDVVDDALRERAETTGSKTIFELNPDTEMYQKMILAKKKTDNGSSGSSTVAPLVLAHISDIHGGSAQYARYIEFANHWKGKGYIDELIDTGDVVTSNYGDGTAWRDGIEGVGNIITVVGNHDTCSTTDERTEQSLSGFDLWNYHSKISVNSAKRKDVYNLLMVGPDSENPYIDNWGVIQPTNASDNGLCYFYKDYTTNDRCIRLIGLDVMGYDSDQHTWFQSVLADARTNNLHVAILTHFTGTNMAPLKCNYTSLRTTGAFGGNYSVYLEQTDPDALAEAVDAFQTAGGVFIGYIIGHYHRDMVNTITGYPKQLVFAVSSGGRSPIRDFTKAVGSKSYDDFQIVSINTYDKTVRLIKVGADIDYYSRKKGTLCVSYEIVTEDNTEKVKGILGEGW